MAIILLITSIIQLITTLELRDKPYKENTWGKIRNFFGLRKKHTEVPKPHTFETGDYVAGKDFETGLYNIVACFGSGHVWCNECGINEIMGDKKTFADHYALTFMIMNVDFQEGTVLHLRGNLQLQMVPKQDSH